MKKINKPQAFTPYDIRPFYEVLISLEATKHASWPNYIYYYHNEDLYMTITSSGTIYPSKTFITDPLKTKYKLNNYEIKTLLKFVMAKRLPYLCTNEIRFNAVV